MQPGLGDLVNKQFEEFTLIALIVGLNEGRVIEAVKAVTISKL